MTLDGTPASGVSLTFIPQEGVKGKGGYAVTDAEGRFEAKADPEVDGIVPGKYRVLFSKVVMPDGSPIPPDTMAADVYAENVLHPAYSDPAVSPVIVTVSESGEQDLVLEIRTRPLI